MLKFDKVGLSHLLKSFYLSSNGILVLGVLTLILLISKMVKKKTCKVKVKTRGDDMTKEFMSQCVQHIAKKIVDARREGCTPHLFAKKLLLEGKKCFPKMNMNMVNYAVRKIDDINQKAHSSNHLLASVITLGEVISVGSLVGDPGTHTTTTTLKKRTKNTRSSSITPPIAHYNVPAALLLHSSIALSATGTDTTNDNRIIVTVASVSEFVASMYVSKVSTTGKTAV